MKRNVTSFVVGLMAVALVFQCSKNKKADVSSDIAYCAAQAEKTLEQLPDDDVLPRNIDQDKSTWRFVEAGDWTSGFWPGILWYLYEGTGDEKWKTQADKATRKLTSLSQQAAHDHDLGFQIFNSFGNGYRLTGNEEYKEVILRTADSLATLFHPKVGTILSWPGAYKEKASHNTIVDNMMNLELLFWASKNGGTKSLYDVAVKHAETTMKNHFRNDYSAYHVVLYDTASGARVAGITAQGYADESMWARGQAWAIYGFTMVYRETKDKKFLEFAEKITDVYLNRLPEDLVPYWDFDAPKIPNEPRDAAAAAITASALLELSDYVSKDKGTEYRHKAKAMIETLSGEAYRSNDKNPAFLLHVTGHKPDNSEVDASIIYADYYYIEALIRLNPEP
ncbi:MAG TPA: glycoside hydrolase family 88 protein [Ohtaekwangia sp.]|nr:glycoside hydrolase family 88 protein [Ohtaekwangia sp.]